MEERKVRPQDKWDAKAGMVPKTYKVRKGLRRHLRQSVRSRESVWE